MSNTQMLPTIGRTTLALQIDDEIRNNCHRQVDKRLALKLANALMQPSNANIFYSERLVAVLQQRIQFRATQIDEYDL